MVCGRGSGRCRPRTRLTRRSLPSLRDVAITLDRSSADDGDWNWAEAATTQWAEEAGRLGVGIRVESEEVPNPERQAAIIRGADDTLWTLNVSGDDTIRAEAFEREDGHHPTPES